MKKQDFVKIINTLESLIKKENEVSDAFRNFSDGDSMPCSPYLSLLLLTLNLTMNDKDNWIPWWLYEDVEKCARIKGKIVDIKTSDKLYDFLVKNYDK